MVEVPMSVAPPAQPATTLGRCVRGALARARTQELAIALIALIVLFWTTAPGFATLYNLTETLRDLSILGVIAVGETFVLIGGGIDLSVGSVLLIAGISVDDMIRLGGMNAAVAVPIALAIGAVAGLLNGLLVTRLRISAFIRHALDALHHSRRRIVALPFRRSRSSGRADR